MAILNRLRKNTHYCRSRQTRANILCHRHLNKSGQITHLNLRLFPINFYNFISGVLAYLNLKRSQNLMSEIVIETDSLRLILQSTEDVLARIESLSPADKTEVSPDWLERLRTSTTADPWTHGFSMVERSSGVVIGSCAYKGPPDQEGVVEIAYEVDPDYQGRGYATEASEALVNFAFHSGQVRLVRAHTLRENNASTRVLTKCGFNNIGEVVDPEDGLVWRWELQEGASQ